MLAVHNELLKKLVVKIEFRLLFPFEFGVFAERFFGIGERRLELRCRKTGLGRMRFVDDHGESTSFNLVDLVVDHGEFL